MNATTPLWALVACLAASLASTTVAADETDSCLPIQTGDQGVEYHPECMPSSSSTNGQADGTGTALPIPGQDA